MPKSIKMKLGSLFLIFLLCAVKTFSQDRDFCPYAGYMSVVKEGRCVPPWELKELDKELLGPLYTRYQSCGPDVAIRCNPLFYGLASEHGKISKKLEWSLRDVTGRCLVTSKNQGCCVQGAGSPDQGFPSSLEPYFSTDVCNKTLIGKDSEALISISRDPKLLAQYLYAANFYISQQCSKPSSNDCRALKSHLSDSIKIFHDQDQNWFCTAAQGYSSWGLATEVRNDFKNIINVLEFINPTQQLLTSKDTLSIFNWADERKRIFRSILDSYEQHPATKRMIDKAMNNTTKCHVIGINNCRSSDQQTKSTRKSLGKCWRYVKAAILNNFINVYPNSGHAREAIGDLENEGFINILENDFFTEITIDNAPIGSIIVYEDIANPRKSGHVEIIGITEGGKKKYISDFSDDQPVSVKHARRPIGIMIPGFQYDEKTGRVDFRTPQKKR